MKTIYIDSDFKCHITNPDGNFRSFETDWFDDKCDEYIKGYRFVPVDETWVRDDGYIFHGEMIAPWKNFNELYIAQLKYENQVIGQVTTEYKESLEILGVEI